MTRGGKAPSCRGCRRPVLGLAALCLLLPAPAARGVPFIRADSDANGTLEITDSIRTLGFLFLGSPPSLACADADDADDDGEVNIADVIFGLTFLFSGGQRPPAPFPGCGEDPSADRLVCGSFPGCGGCDGLVPGPLSTVNAADSHGLRLIPGSGGELIAFYHEVGNVYGQRMTDTGTLRGERVLAAAGVVDFDAATSGGTVAVVHLSGGRVFATILAAADLTVVKPETLILSPGAATDRVRINGDAARGTMIVVYEIGGTLSAFSVPFPELRPASPSRILSIGVSRRFAVVKTGSPAYVFYTLDSDGLLRGVRLNADGSRDGQTVAITSGAGDDVDPAVARSGVHLGLAYGHSEPGADRLRFVVLDSDLSPARGPIDLSGLTSPVFLVHDPPGVNTPIAVADLGGGRFLVTALNLQALESHWYAHEVLPDDLASAGLTFRRLLPETCDGHPCSEDYGSVAAVAAGERALLGSTRRSGGGGDSVRVTALVCP